MDTLAFHSREQLEQLRKKLLHTTGENGTTEASLGEVLQSPQTPQRDFNLLVRLHRGKSPLLLPYIAHLRLKYEQMEKLPPQSHFIRYNLGLYAPSAPHIAIVNCNNLKVTPQEVAAGAGAGSEEALVEVSTLLATSGFRVTIFAEIEADSGLTLASSNPRYYPRNSLHTFSENDISLCLAWRRTDWWRLKQYLRCPVIYCPHDWATGETLQLEGLDGKIGRAHV